MKKSKKAYLSKKIADLELLKSIPKKKHAQFVQMMDEEFIHSICECLHNLFANSFNLKPVKCKHLRQQFGPIKKDVKVLINENSSLKKRKKILGDEQTGAGLFTILASIVLPALISAVSGGK